MASIATFALLFVAAASSVAASENKVKIAEAVPLVVPSNARIAVPIRFVAGDYNGPYDPLDPKGITAALHRLGKIQGAKNIQLVKSYIPPGLGDMAKKEIVNLAMSEGQRFAFAHPKETAEIVGIATKAKSLYETASHKLKTMENGGNKFPW